MEPTARRRVTRDGAREKTRASLPIVGIVLVALICLGGGFLAVRHLMSLGEVRQEERESEKSPEELAAETAREHAKQIVDGLSLEEKVAQVFVVRPEAITGVEVATEAGQTTRETISKNPVCGLMYSEQNLVDEKQTQKLLKNTQNYVKDASGLPALLCVEEEGGSYGPVANAYMVNAQVAGAARIGASNETEDAREAAHQVGEYLSELGFNTNIAPVADIVSSVESDLSERSFGDDPQKVASMVAAQVDGYARSGELCAVKHFPGIGEAEKDPHNGRLYSHRTLDELMEREVVPFAAAIKEDVPIVVVSSMSCLELGNGEGDLPSWMSEAVVTDLLRGELGYKGVVMTDQLDDEAIADACDPADQAVRAIKAGCDIIVCPQDYERAYRGLINAVEEGDISEKRLDESVRRIVLLKEGLSD